MQMEFETRRTDHSHGACKHASLLSQLDLIKVQDRLVLPQIGIFGADEGCLGVVHARKVALDGIARHSNVCPVRVHGSDVRFGEDHWDVVALARVVAVLR